MRRKESIGNLVDSTVFDILIVGGGITGAGAFKQAHKRGYNAILVEKEDFASGTSSRSAKLAHGGMRYLKYLQFGLVHEALTQRDQLIREYPHLVRPLRFICPIYSIRAKVEMFIGMVIYQMLNISSDLFGFKFMSKGKSLKKYPSINGHGLKGCYSYYDAVTNDARLCNEVIHETIRDHGAKAINYCELKSLETNNDEVIATCHDGIENKDVTIRTKYLINASGPWMDELNKKVFNQASDITAPSKGVHLVFSRTSLPIDDAVIFNTDDQRMLYTVPWENNTVLVGATDTDYSTGIDKASIDNSDVEYILKAMRTTFPSMQVSEEQIVSVLVGVRPLLNAKNTSSKDRSREYRIWWSQERVLSMFGGKLTGFNTMAKKAIDMMETKKIHRSNTTSNRTERDIDNEIKGIDTQLVSYLQARYQKESTSLLKLCMEQPETMEKLHPELSNYLVEVLYFVRYQSCYHIDDVLGRRLSLSYILPGFKHKMEIITKTAHIMRAEHGWTKEEFNTEIDNYLSLLSRRNLIQESSEG